MDTLLDEWFGFPKKLASQENDARRAVPDLIELRYRSLLV
jgi:hypothetical protein